MSLNQQLLLPMMAALWPWCSACTAHIDGDPNRAAVSVPGAAGMGAATSAAGSSPADSTHVDPGPTWMRRLTNAEYSQTLVDLLGEPPDAATRLGLPEDPRSAGFDNDAELETISDVRADRYTRAAETLASAVLASPARQAGVLGCDATSAGCLDSFVRSFGRRAYRRPLSADEVSSFIELGTDAGGGNDGFKVVLEAMLASPHFLFRVEVGQADAAGAGLVRLNGFELATRLSYLLWGTTPDPALLDRAQAGDLDTSAGLDAVAQSMLTDARARTALRRFYAQWLTLGDLKDLPIDTSKFKTWSPQLAGAMVEETSRFVDSVIWDSTSAAGGMLQLLSARYTFVNGALAALYGLPPAGDDWRRVDFPNGMPRVGILTQPGILTVTSHSDSISNTRRGLYVRQVLMCQDLPPPPAGVNAVLPAAQPGETERQRFSRHTTDPICASCHTQMDPIGWGLSGFDAIGAASLQPEDVSGRVEGLVSPDFNGPLELAERLHGSSQFADCVGTSLYRFAYGVRDVGQHAQPLAELQQAFRDSGFDFRHMLLALTRSNAFRYRRLPPANGCPAGT